MEVHLGNAQVDEIVREFGDKGKAWTQEFPSLLSKCIDKWELTLTGIATGGLDVNVIAFGEQPDGGEVTLKIGFPQPEQLTEMIALRLYDGSGVVQYLDSDPVLGALLIRRLKPGNKLRALDANDQETRIASRLMEKLPRQLDHPHDLPHFDDWINRAFTRFNTSDRKEQAEFGRLVDQAGAIYADISRSDSPDLLLHGDLHHENILFDDNLGWVAIDPKGVIGKACLELGRYLHNFLPRESCDLREHLVRERAAIISDNLDLSITLVMECGFVDMVLSTCWTIESKDSGIHNGIQDSELMFSLLGS